MTVRVVTRALRPEGWPKGLRCRIVMIADLHACARWMPLSRIARIVDQAQALDGDLIALLGDYSGHILFGRSLRPEDVTAELARLRAPLGVWAVFGNHDWYDSCRHDQGQTPWHIAFDAAGIATLNNSNAALSQHGFDFTLAGIDSQRAFHHDKENVADGADDLSAALDGAPNDRPAILLAHEPDIFDDVADPIVLTLSGHTHGGQIRLFGRAPVVPSRFGERFAYGHIVENGRHLIVSAGLGYTTIPLRIGIPPEITVVELR